MSLHITSSILISSASPPNTCRLSSAMSIVISPNSFQGSIPRSSSEPNISKTKKHSSLPPSNRSTSSTKTIWRKGGKYKARKSGSKHSDLTEASLDEFNRRNAVADDKKNSSRSPYYKGLTDSTLYISRQRNSQTSPERESHGTAVTSSSISTVFSKIQEWGTSCFKSRRDSARNSSSSKTKFIDKDVDLEKKDIVSLIESSASIQEPLRERVSEAVAPSPVVAKRVIFVEKVAKPMEAKPIEREFFWSDRYRPKALKDFICNRDKADHLHDMLGMGRECSHYIFEGPAGVGKRTMVWALLREVFGPDISKTREGIKVFELKGESVGHINVNVKESSQHVEVNLSELRGYEKHVIVALIKQTNSIVLNKAMQSCNHTNCRAIILYEADKLSTDAQLYIRWLLERYRGCNKVFFCCSDASKLQPIKSLCTIIQLLPPSNKEIVEVLEFIAKEEGIELPHKLAVRIAENSKHNLRQAIRSFEASWQLNYPLKEDQVIMTGWEEDIANIAKNIIEEQSPRQLYTIRGKLQKLIEHNVCPVFIFSTLVAELKKNLDNQFHSKIDALYQEYNRDNVGIFDGEKSSALLFNPQEEMVKRNNDPTRKNVQHFMKIEEFTAKFMSFYKSSVMKNVGGPNVGAI
ncbi:hypothetical protein HHK36_028197 [Tetracentron sinense]|uniref:Replication factor C subunit 3 n=1 Tax=Tetracentron sinense TaxID=13715 RepID=A0A835D1R9_TETSI|nr:hypothetical protein HHK36_028197 [Tetracentron sinense]